MKLSVSDQDKFQYPYDKFPLPQKRIQKAWSLYWHLSSLMWRD